MSDSVIAPKKHEQNRQGQKPPVSFGGAPCRDAGDELGEAAGPVVVMERLRIHHISMDTKKEGE